MFKHLFATMNETLDVIIEHYPTAVDSKKQDLVENVKQLKAMSNTFIEEWLLFEEKLDQWNESTCVLEDESPFILEILLNEQDPSGSEAFLKGHGYFLLHMYDYAINQFEQVVSLHPNFILAELYLSLGYLQIGNFTLANHHLKKVIPQQWDGIS